MWDWSCRWTGDDCYFSIKSWNIKFYTINLQLYYFTFEKFRNVSQHLVGVDLSPSIIEEAKKTRPLLYDDTRVGDVTEIFLEMKPISLIIAADSFIYFGDLDPLFSSIVGGLEDGGFVAFNLENVSTENERK